MKKHNAGCIKIATELLRQWLCLPSDIDIIGVYQEEADRQLWGEFRVSLCGPGLPEVLEGGVIPEITAKYKHDYNKNKVALVRLGDRVI